MSGQAEVQEGACARPMFAWQCPDCGLMDDPAEGYLCRDGRHGFSDPVEVVPLSVAEALAEMLERVRPIIGSNELHNEVEHALAAYREAHPTSADQLRKEGT